MKIRNNICFFIVSVIALVSCRVNKDPSIPPTETMSSKPENGDLEIIPRSLLTAQDLLKGFIPVGVVDEEALAMPVDALQSPHFFEGQLELLDPGKNGIAEVLFGSLTPEKKHLPPFNFAYAQWESYLIPVQRGKIVTQSPAFDIILEPGRIWQEKTDQGYSRASLPFSLVFKGDNAVLNGTLTFLFNGSQVSKVWYQVTQETTTRTRANLWGLLSARYHPRQFTNAAEIQQGFQDELENQVPTLPIGKLKEYNPNIDLAAFGAGVTPEHMAWYGVIIDGINYLGGCQTRAGIYPYCEWMRQPSYSIAKSIFPALAMMRLAQEYDPGVPQLLIKDYVAEAKGSIGNWENVTFNHTLDMATGNFDSAEFMTDDSSEQMNLFFGAKASSEKISAAFDWPNKGLAGSHWVYRTSDTFIVTLAMQNYLSSQAGEESDIFEYVVEEIYRPLGMSPGTFSTKRTSDNNWQGQAEGGYGLWLIPDDIAKITRFLLFDSGKIQSEQILHPGMLAAALQNDISDRGITYAPGYYYNNAFWAQQMGPRQGFNCAFWVTYWQGISGNVVALFPNNTVYYYFSDSHDFAFLPALREVDKISPICP